MKRVSPWFSLLVVAVVFVTGCGKTQSPAGRAQESAAAVPLAAQAADTQAASPLVRRSFEVTAELDVTVQGDKAREALVQRLTSRASAVGGYVGQAETQGTTTTLVLRIPAKDIESFERDFGATGNITRRTMKSVDVTEAVLDVEARLRAARAEEDRLLKLLSDRTGSLSDVLAVERSLADVRARIEQLDAQDRAQKSRVALATVTLRLFAEPPSTEASFGAAMKDAASDGLHAVRFVAQGAVLVALRAGPTLLLLGLLLVGIVQGVRLATRRAKPTPTDA